MKRTPFALASLATLAAMPAAAHHSFDMFFDRAEPISLTGRVTEFAFANPHTYFKLEVTGADGTRQEWHIETTSGGQLGDHGWDAASIKPGEMLTVKAYAGRNGRPYARLQSMSYANGGTVALWLPAGPAPLTSGG